ncbi:hypothetical protein AN958_02236 [Leucoagaricus sp. SymC.cos]|nr:hypothetical protein AN958_02236 [Leucoagaricus sp. SymC.cos]
MVAKSPHSSNIVVHSTKGHTAGEDPPPYMGAHTPAQTMALSPEEMPSAPRPRVFVVNPGIGLTKADLTFTHKELEFFTRPVTLADLEDDSTIHLSDTESEVEVAAILSCSPITSEPVTLPAVDEPNAFEEAKKYGFRGISLPGDEDEASGPVYVVFRGIEPGLYGDSSAATAQILNVSNAYCCKFSTLREARAEWDFARSNGTAGYLTARGQVVVKHVSSTIQSPNGPILTSTTKPQPVKYEEIKVRAEAIIYANAAACESAEATEGLKGKGKAGSSTADTFIANTVAEALVALRDGDPAMSPVPSNMVAMGQATSSLVQISSTGALSQAVPPLGLAPSTGYNPNEKVWVVLKGKKPGVYTTRTRAESEGIGSANPAHVLVALVEDEAHGNAVFVKAFGQSLIERL